MKFVSPSTKETAFNCAHCGVLTTQYWYSVRADSNNREHPLPTILRDGDNKDTNFSDIEEPELRNNLVAWAKLMRGKVPFFEEGKDGKYSFQNVYNLNLSRCYNCSEISVWVHDNLVYPRLNEAPVANIDMPLEIRGDYDEASAILNISPRGSAALIRLCIQKLMKELGQSGKNINEHIANLVVQGLDVRLQKALDAVRVIGNNAVHPGKIDLKDDRSTAESLFKLLNIIVEKMISEPKHIEDVYRLLPEGAVKAIDERDKGK